MSGQPAGPEQAPTTFHLTPEEVWNAQHAVAAYLPEAYPRDGFIHCTDGEANVLAVGNAFYRDDARPYVALVLDQNRLSVPVRYEDDARIYPHIYGPLNREAVVAVRRVVRAPDGTFVGIVASDS